MTEAPPTDAEQQAAFARSLAFNTEAVRSGMFSAAIDMANVLRDKNIPHADAIITTAAIEFAVQLGVQVMLRAGHGPGKVREWLDGQVQEFFIKHLMAEQGSAPAAVKS